MNKIIISILALLLTACSYQMPAVEANKGRMDRVYDYDGDYAGHIDKTGRIYDKDGNYLGMIK